MEWTVSITRPLTVSVDINPIKDSVGEFLRRRLLIVVPIDRPDGLEERDSNQQVRFKPRRRFRGTGSQRARDLLTLMMLRSS